MAERKATITRKTAETSIDVSLELDGTGVAEISTGVGFLDHMLTLLVRHGLFDAIIKANGDTDVDGHHTVEDVGICLGKALAEAAGDKCGITRYGSMLLPMEEALARVALDLSGRPHLEWRADIPTETVGDFDTCLAREFTRAFAVNGGINIHVDLLAGSDPHHSIEAIFKSMGRALRQAVSIDPREKGIPSSKGIL